MSNIIENSDDDSHATVVRPFNRLEADFAYEFENELGSEYRRILHLIEPL